MAELEEANIQDNNYDLKREENSTAKKIMKGLINKIFIFFTILKLNQIISSLNMINPHVGHFT